MSIDDVRVSGIEIILVVARKTVSISIDVVRVSGIGRSVFIVRGTHKSPDPAKISVSEGVVRGSTVQGSAFVSEDEVRVSTVRESAGEHHYAAAAAATAAAAAAAKRRVVRIFLAFYSVSFREFFGKIKGFPFPVTPEGIILRRNSAEFYGKMYCT